MAVPNEPISCVMKSGCCDVNPDGSHPMKFFCGRAMSRVVVPVPCAKPPLAACVAVMTTDVGVVVGAVESKTSV